MRAYQIRGKAELVELSPHDEANAWAAFMRHPIKDVLHNELVKKIEGLRDKLEKAEAKDFQSLQAEISAHRFLFGLIHRNDPLPTK